MKYCVVINSPPSLAASQYAYDFCRALTQEGHQLSHLFFQGEGVLHGHVDEETAAIWGQFADTDKLCCSASIDTYFPKIGASPTSFLHHDFLIAGLGQLIEAEYACDRILCFGEKQ